MATRVPLSDIVRLPEYQGMNRAQQLWVKIYLSSGEGTGVYDPVLSTKLAYPKCAPENLATRASHVQSHKRVREILAIAFNKPMLTSVLPGLDRVIQKSIKADMKSGGGLSVATTRAITFYENAVRRARAKDDDAVQKFFIGEQFEQDGQMFEIKAVEIAETE